MLVEHIICSWSRSKSSGDLWANKENQFQFSRFRDFPTVAMTNTAHFYLGTKQQPCFPSRCFKHTHTPPVPPATSLPFYLAHCKSTWVFWNTPDVGSPLKPFLSQEKASPCICLSWNSSFISVLWNFLNTPCLTKQLLKTTHILSALHELSHWVSQPWEAHVLSILFYRWENWGQSRVHLSY